jgi:chorismate--pyruvate lyase
MARTVIPHSTLTGAERQLLALNNKPLGEFLFSHKNMSRNSIQIKRGRVDQNLIWGRRSIFKLNNKPLLVSEYFLPSLLEVTP